MASSTAAKKTVVASEPYMSNEHVTGFRDVLNQMLNECTAELRNAMQSLFEESDRTPDAADSSDISQQREEARQIANKLSSRRNEIEAALRRLDSGDYGYCEETGDEIGLPRLHANPLARLCIEAASRREHLNRMRVQ